jgi:hypothetical protein
MPKAIRASDAVVVCLSGSSVTKEGYLQKEIKDALQVAEEKPRGTIFIIPVRLQEVDLPDDLSQWQAADICLAPGETASAVGKKWRLGLGPRASTRLFIDKRLVLLNPIQNTLQLHRVPPCIGFCVTLLIQDWLRMRYLLPSKEQSPYFYPQIPRRRPFSGGGLFFFRSGFEVGSGGESPPDWEFLRDGRNRGLCIRARPLAVPPMSPNARALSP